MGIKLELKMKIETIIQNEVEVVSSKVHVDSGSANHVNDGSSVTSYVNAERMFIKLQKELSRQPALYVVCCRYYYFGII